MGGDRFELAKWVAVGLMTADHLALSLPVPWPGWGTVASRLCLPVFVFLMAVRLAEGRQGLTGSYARRLLLWGLVAQPLYWLVHPAAAANVLLTLLLGVVAVAVIQRGDKLGLVGLSAALAPICAAFVLVPARFDGGAMLLGLPVAWLVIRRWGEDAGLVVVLGFGVLANWQLPWVCWASVAAAVPVLYLSERLTGYVPRLPGPVFYGWYSATLALPLLFVGPWRMG